MKVDELSDVELALRPHRVRGPVMAAFLHAAAIQPQAAIRYRPATPEAGRALARLVAAGVVRPTDDGQWFDLRRHYHLERARELRWMVGAVAFALVGAAIAVLFYRG